MTVVDPETGEIVDDDWDEKNLGGRLVRFPAAAIERLCAEGAA